MLGLHLALVALHKWFTIGIEQGVYIELVRLATIHCSIPKDDNY